MAEGPRPTTRGQIRAQRAYGCVEQRKGRGEAEYLRYARSLPALIHGTGLAQALAFADAKQRDALLQDLATVLEVRRDDLLQQSRECALPRYLQLSREALSAAEWLKRYAEALLEDEEP